VPSTECPAALGRALLYRAELGLDALAALNICEEWEGHDGHPQPAHATHCKEGVLAQYTLQTLGEGLRGLLPAPAEGERFLSSLSIVRASLGCPQREMGTIRSVVGLCRSTAADGTSPSTTELPFTGVCGEILCSRRCCLPGLTHSLYPPTAAQPTKTPQTWTC